MVIVINCYEITDLYFFNAKTSSFLIHKKNNIEKIINANIDLNQINQRFSLNQ